MHRCDANLDLFPTAEQLEIGKPFRMPHNNAFFAYNPFARRHKRMNKVFLTGQKNNQLSDTTILRTSCSFGTDASCQVNENTTYPMKHDFVRLICRFEMMSNH